MKFNSIRHKLAFGISLFMTLLLALLATGTYLYFKHASRELILNQQFAMVSREARNIDDHLKQAKQSLTAVANRASSTRLNDSSAIEAWLGTHVATRAIFSSSLFFLDKTGVMRGAVPARPRDYGSSFADRDYFTSTMNSGKARISAPILSRETKKPVVILTAPVRGTDGSIAGVLCGRLDLMEKDSLLAALNEIKLGSNGYLYLFAKDRTLIMHPDPSRIMKNDVKPGMNKLFDWAIEGFEGSGETVNSKGIPFLSSFKYLASAEWILAANYPVEEAYRSINIFRNYFIGAVIAALLTSIALAWRLGVGISRPLCRFTEQITDLAQNNSQREKRLDESRDDELGLLAVSFNKLLDTMQQREQERNQAVEASMAAEARNEMLLQTTDQGIYGTDAQGCFTYINRAGLAVLGYESNEVVGKHSHSLIHHTHSNGSPYPAEECPVHRANRAKSGCHVDSELLWRKDGSSFIAELSSYPLIENDEFIGSVVTFSDVSLRRQEEDTRRKLARAVEQCPVTIAITDTTGAIEFVNPRFTELTGYTFEQAIGQNPRILKSNLTPPEVFVDLWSTITQGKTWEGDFVNKSKDGTLFWEHAVISALLDEKGDIRHYLAVKEDITEKRRIQEELISARDKAEAGTLAKSQFLATMSHEIRTPMNGVIGMTGLLLETELNEEQRGYAEIVNRSGESLLSLINDILDFSKIEAGRLDMESIDFNLRTALEDTTDILKFRAQDAGLELICQIDPAVPEYLKGDPGRLRQIVTNLAGNAIKFTHQGEVVIGAKLASEQGERVTIHFSVRDTGIGIPQSRLAAVFEPFTQADGSTTRKYGGTGLGLAICKQLAGLMGGEIGIESEEGIGSTFWFTAQFIKQTSLEVENSAPLLHADIKGSRILVVDDNATNRKLMAALLSQWGCSYELAVDAMSGLQQLREAVAKNNRFDVALLDQEMPGMDGSELGRQIKADPLLQSTVMIMVTSLAQRGDAAAFEKIGFSGYLPKPVRQSHLYSCIALALDRARTTPAPAAIITRHTVAEIATRGLRILLAEDNVINQKVAQSILGKLGYKADIAANGLEAVQALETAEYDIVLMDCMMPELDGFEATAVIRDPASKVLNHRVPIIAMTANAMQGDREHCLDAGMDDYLAKPVKKDELAALLEKWGKNDYEKHTDS